MPEAAPELRLVGRLEKLFWTHWDYILTEKPTGLSYSELNDEFKQFALNRTCGWFKGAVMILVGEKSEDVCACVPRKEIQLTGERCSEKHRFIYGNRE